MNPNTVQLTVNELEDMLDRAADRGARKALESLGLHDEHAGDDLKDLRNFLTSWRATKDVVWQTAAKMVTTGVLLTIGMAMWLYLRNQVGSK